MKPCFNNRKRIAWLALGSLETRQANVLRAHIETCSGCRHYFEEISDVAEKLTTEGVDSDLPAPESLHQKVVGSLRNAQRVSSPEVRSTTSPRFGQKLGTRWNASLPLRVARDLAISDLQALMGWRVAMPLLAAVVVVIAALAIWLRPPTNSAAPAVARAKSMAVAKIEVAPSIGHYQMVANQSLEKLDDLVTRQGNQNQRSVPIYTASSIRRTEIWE